MALTLSLLRDRYVFESTPARHYLGALHVPFDDLVGDQRTETRLGEAVRRQERTALIGASGSGKSSVIAYTLTPDQGIAPLVIPLAALPAETIGTPSQLVDHLLATVIRQAGEAVDDDTETKVAPRSETVTTTRRTGVAAGWGWLKGDLAKEVQRQTEIERTATFDDKTDVVASVLDAITAGDLQPALVFDDTDRWLTNTDPELVQRFFGEGIRWLLDLPTSLIVAVHPHYFTNTLRPTLLQYIDTPITVPHIPHPDGIAAILTRRIEIQAQIEDPDLTSVLDTGAIGALHDVYTATESLRRTIQVCHTAVYDSLDAGDIRLTDRHIAAAASAE